MQQTAPQTTATSEPTSITGATTPASNEAAEFVVSRQDLLEEIAQLQGAVNRKSTIPILSNILMQATGQAVHLTATDLDLSIRTSCPAKVVKQGAFTIPARKFYDYLRLLPDGDITVKVLANNWVQLRSGRSHTKMVGLPRTNFPSLPLFPRDAAMKIEADVLHNLISRTAFAISKEESRYTLNGALLVLKPQGTTMVATDGHRMALIEHTKSSPAITQETKILIPKKALLEMSSLLAGSAGEYIHFAENDSTLFFVIGKRLLTSRRLVGTFPNYEAVLPRDNNSAVVIGRDEFYSSIMRVAQFADERSNAIRVRLEKNELKLSSSTVEAGESEDVLQTSFNGDPTAIGFNSHYLLDFLKVVGTEHVRLEFKGAQTAMEFKPEEPATGDYRYRYVVMPVRI
jgi:DNA polymerase III subunit beta